MVLDISTHEICIGELLSKLCKHSWDRMMKFVLINISNRAMPAVYQTFFDVLRVPFHQTFQHQRRKKKKKRRHLSRTE